MNTTERLLEREAVHAVEGSTDREEDKRFYDTFAALSIPQTRPDIKERGPISRQLYRLLYRYSGGKRWETDPEAMKTMMWDQTQYIMAPKIRFVKSVGLCASYDIAAYDNFSGSIVANVPDVTADRALALRLVRDLNEIRLPPFLLGAAVRERLQGRTHKNQENVPNSGTEREV